MRYLFLMFLISCNSFNEENEKYDFMFTLSDGTWVCDNHIIYSNYEHCEHVLTGKKSDRISIGRDTSVIRINEGTI